MPHPLQAFAERYTAAWCSHDATLVASFYEPEGSLTINDGPPALGRDAIAASAQSFFSGFPDLQVFLDTLSTEHDHPTYHWTLEGTHSGSGNRVRISGYESWTISPNNLIAASQGHFDAADYQRQIS